MKKINFLNYVMNSYIKMICIQNFGDQYIFLNLAQALFKQGLFEQVIESQDEAMKKYKNILAEKNILFKTIFSQSFK
ncbi:unnamed protein product [Paramecium primaurelia]|uniref:Uncharacterized protein n=1 Tax=Paramecium primaurelia TaxID=5886 RepID=A0A8S1PTH8_PARPR|nr:unnamed protein product [Paramecium primaurelia]CAD8105898.1 unnamed protein product [Paramecium primaurelia]